MKATRRYPDLQPEATRFWRAAFSLRLRQESLRHGILPDELPDVLELEAEEQRERLTRSAERMRARGA